MQGKKEYLILAVIIIAAGLYLVFHKSDQTQYDLPEIPKIEIDAVSRLEIKTPDETIALKKKDKERRLVPQDYPADGAKIKGMLFEMEEIVLSDLVSESKSYERYELGDTRKIVVKAWVGDKVVREFEIGKEAATYQHTFLRLPDNPNVYHARGDFRRKFKESAADLRDREVLAFDPDALKGIRLTSGDETLQLKRASTQAQPDAEPAGEKPAAPAKPAWQTAAGRTVDSAALESFLNAINNLKCDSYVEDRKKDDFKEALFEIMLDGKQTYTLSLFAKEKEKDTALPATSSYNAYPFRLSTDRLESWRKTFNKLAGKEDQETKE